MHSKKILKNEQADLAMSIYGNHYPYYYHRHDYCYNNFHQGNLVNNSVQDQAVDPVDLAISADHHY